MPLYEFQCTCGHKFELICSVSGENRPSDVCPLCKSPQIRRVISAPNIKVKDGTPKFYPKGKSK